MTLQQTQESANKEVVGGHAFIHLLVNIISVSLFILEVPRRQTHPFLVKQCCISLYDIELLSREIAAVCQDFVTCLVDSGNEVAGAGE
jgi:hypothetical protein